jgi:hypothetical protein
MNKALVGMRGVSRRRNTLARKYDSAMRSLSPLVLGALYLPCLYVNACLWFHG